MNLPNTITFSRIIAVPLIIYLLASAELSSIFGIKELVASAIFILASITDGVDGYIARRRGQVTTVGEGGVETAVLQRDREHRGGGGRAVGAGDARGLSGVHRHARAGSRRAPQALSGAIHPCRAVD